MSCSECSERATHQYRRSGGDWKPVCEEHAKYHFHYGRDVKEGLRGLEELP